jgi:hypothetical protein
MNSANATDNANANQVNNIMNGNKMYSNNGKKLVISIPIPQVTIPNPFSFVKNKIDDVKNKIDDAKNKLLQLQNLKYAAIAMINILATKEGQVLFQSLLKGIEPSMKLFTDEMLIQVEKNKPQIVELVKELGQPVSQAVRESMGTIPGVGEGLAAYLALKNITLASLNGANLASSVVDNFIINPASKVLGETGKVLKNVSNLKNQADSVKKDFNNILQLFDKIDKETSKIEKMANNGSSLETLLNKQPENVPQKIKGGMRREHIIRNSTKRIKKWVGRFFNTTSKRR